MSSNVQLSQSERCVVFRDANTKRILGFGIEGIAPSFPKGTKILSEVCYHAHEMDRRAQEYRDQCKIDAEISTQQKLEYDQPMRKAIKDAIREHNNHCSPWNRHLNNALLKVMDKYYEDALSARRNAEVALVAEKYEACKTSTEIAMESNWKPELK